MGGLQRGCHSFAGAPVHCLPNHHGSVWPSSGAQGLEYPDLAHALEVFAILHVAGGDCHKRAQRRYYRHSINSYTKRQVHWAWLPAISMYSLQKAAEHLHQRCADLCLPLQKALPGSPASHWTGPILLDG